jgi:hypothetical protein
MDEGRLAHAFATGRRPDGAGPHVGSRGIRLWIRGTFLCTRNEGTAPRFAPLDAAIKLTLHPVSSRAFSRAQLAREMKQAHTTEYLLRPLDPQRAPSYIGGRCQKSFID